MTADHAAEVSNGRGACLAAQCLRIHAQRGATIGCHDE